MGARIHYPDRTAALAHLANAGIDVLTWGGRGDDPDQRSLRDYFETLDATRIALNFCKTQEGIDQVKGRPFEAMSAHCCVVEPRGSPLSQYFEPDVEYATWGDHDELVSVVRALIADPEKARRIAARGHAAVAGRWSGSRM